MLYVHPAAAGQGVGTMLVDALEKLAAARGAKRLTADVERQRAGFLREARLRAAAAQHGAARRRMARQHHDGKDARRRAGSRRMSKRTPLSVRHHAARRRADERRRLHAARQARHREAARRARRRLHRGRLSGREPDRHRVVRARSAGFGATFTAFGMTRRPGRSTSNDPGLATLLDAKADAICFVAKSWDYHVRVALETTNEENLASIRDSVTAAKAKGPRGADRLRAFLRRLQGQSGLCARLRQGRLRGRRALGRAVRHQWRHAAARGRARSSARWRSTCPAIMSASTPITTPSRRWRIRSPRCAPARGRSRARSTGSASAAATPIWCRSSRR